MRMLAFVDLDLTLFDYSAVREGATRVALEAMNTDCNIDDAIALMNSALIPYGDLLVEANLPNFRKEWKAPELFALLSCVCRRSGIDARTEKFKIFFTEISRMPLPDHGTSFRKRLENALLLRQTPYAAQVDGIKKELGELLRSTSYQIKNEDAIAAFNLYLRKEAIPSRGVAELLVNLSARGFEVYVVSEGDESIQREKVSALNLESQIDGLYVSSSCCRSQLLLDWLWKQASGARDENRETETRAFAVLYDEALQYNTKSESFFRKVLHSVLVPHSDRANFYHRFGWLSQPACSVEEPVHILLFGDRYDKDLSPGIEAFRNVISVRLLAGKYKETFQSDYLERSQLPQPTATVTSVTQAAQFIERISYDHGLPRSNVTALPANSERIQTVSQAFQEITQATNSAPSWIVEQLEGLNIALLGSETTQK